MICRDRGLDGLAITDHNTLAHDLGEDMVILPGIEISSRDGHVIGLGVSETIPRGLSADETIRRIRGQNGVSIIPHPYDHHPDHVHTGYFVIEAVTSLRERGVLVPSPTVLTYLVHFPNWPATRGPRWDRAYPLAEVGDTQWTGLDLAPADLAAKRAALAEYKTQLGAMSGFLHGFLCQNELFGTVDGELLARIASVH